MRADAPSEPYYHVRFRWKRVSSSSELIEKLKQDFTLTLHAREAEETKLYDWSPYTGHR